jgi:hypothetical protein
MNLFAAALGLTLALVALATLVTKRDHWIEYVWAAVSLPYGLFMFVVGIRWFVSSIR